MTSLKTDLVGRIARLPKPVNVAAAMQPIFEAVSNAIHSTQAKFGDFVADKGKVVVTVTTARNKEDVWTTIEDNGVGLNEENFSAFTTTDTAHKIEIGGKGVGRLLWLDAFEDIRVNSVFEGSGKFWRREFRFVLKSNDQLAEESLEEVQEAPTRFHVTMRGIRDNGYLAKFPGRREFVFRHFVSHFLPTFIGGRCPKITLISGDETRHYPEDISSIVLRQSDEIAISTKDHGELRLTLLECDKSASSDLKGRHFVHFIAHDRTVQSQSIDAKLGLAYFGPGADRVFHGVLRGDYLDANVNQERTAFMFEDAVLEKIISESCWPAIEDFLSEALTELNNSQRDTIQEITESYPSVAFGPVEELQAKIPAGELNGDAIFGHLSRERYRRDVRQGERIRHVMSRLKNDGGLSADDLDAAIREARDAIEGEEQKSLAEYVVRRKVVLDFLELLLEKVRVDDRDSSYQREEILHSFICPVKTHSLESGETRYEPTSHDLWIVDERLTFASYFSSDVEFSRLSKAIDSDERADLLIFDRVHGLKETDNASSVLVVEFKRPGREDYADDENPQMQVERYVKLLISGGLKNVRGRPINLDKNTIFYCYIVADIVGKLDDWTFSWQRTVDGRGRVYRPQSGFNGVIELIGWDDLLKDARARNRAFFDHAGLSGKSLFSIDGTAPGKRGAREADQLTLEELDL